MVYIGELTKAILAFEADGGSRSDVFGFVVRKIDANRAPPTTNPPTTSTEPASEQVVPEAEKAAMESSMDSVPENDDNIVVAQEGEGKEVEKPDDRAPAVPPTELESVHSGAVEPAEEPPLANL